MKPHPELVGYLPWNPFKTLHEFEVHFEQLIRSDPTWCVFAALDKSKLDPDQGKAKNLICPHLLLCLYIAPDSQLTPFTAVDTARALAGTIGYLRASPELSSVEIGYVIILPAYQRTFVSTHAIGLLLDYALQKPSDGGLGLRRVQWQAHADNAASIRAAQRMGLKLEGILRWERTVPTDKDNGIKARDDDVLQRRGRHSAMLAMCWDDWEEEGREHVQKMMARRS
ncbi:GNAT family acetyltransferase, putative [Rhizoctonia solani AG-3 Rhs1AP]|uniref:GNAT family acetyltransferase, putative n=1 Tax=Rhizoctonia solani AG-3 Rhs1AP TaxID=1086054 RepID=A0A0A1UMA6_9AGAM|nr:GNAT family acetyltransferase, putative [Rhizoctonia solani AG-3 Rhs1AP]